MKKSIGPSDDNTTDDVTFVIIVQYTVGEHSLIISYTQFVNIDPIISEVSLIGEPKHIIVVTVDEHIQ